MSKPKPGKVIRIDPLSWNYVKEKIRKNETITGVIRRLLGLPSRGRGLIEGRQRFALPSDLHDSAEDARGAAILKAVKRGSFETEKPILVKEVE